MEPDDQFLVQSMAGGDPVALTKLMDRYDRLVRYSIFRLSRDRCAKDPLWLDGLASGVWAGFVEAVRNPARSRPESVRSFLVTMARNQAVSALRGVARSQEVAAGGPQTDAPDRVTAEDPGVLLQHLELLEALRVCLRELDEEDGRILSQLPAIMDRRWRDAAAALGRSESTLRSQWKKLLERIRASFARRTGTSLAPEDWEGD